jgi:CBS domain-containing protein
MSGKVVGIVPDAPLPTAMHLMADAGFRHLPVIDGPDCVGMLLESDVIERLAEGRGSLIAAPVVWVGQICRRPAVTMPLSNRRSDAAQRMVSSGIDAVLVTARGRIVGIVTAADLVRSLAEEHAVPTVDVAVRVSP